MWRIRLNAGIGCYQSVLKFLVFCLLLKIVKIKILTCKAIMLPALICGCESWCLTLKEEHRWRTSENRILRRIFGMNIDICILHQFSSAM
jgi:hypothetical protein